MQFGLEEIAQKALAQTATYSHLLQVKDDLGHMEIIHVI